MTMKLAYGIPYHGDQRGPIHTGCSAEVLPSSTFRLRFIAVGKRWGDDTVDFPGDIFTDRTGQQSVSAQRQMRPVLFSRADRQEDHRARLHAVLIVDPADVIHPYVVHGFTPVSIGHGESPGARSAP